MADKYNIVNGKSYKEISSQEEYDKELSWYNQQLLKYANPMNIIKQNPFKMFDALLEIWDRCEGIGLFSKEFLDIERKKLYDGIKDINLKKKIKKYLIRIGVLKE